jgi:hypothetical protein
LSVDLSYHRREESTSRLDFYRRFFAIVRMPMIMPASCGVGLDAALAGVTHGSRGSQAIGGEGRIGPARTTGSGRLGHRVPRFGGERRPPAGTLAWRQYQVKLLSGHTAILGFSLADPHDESIADLKRAHHAAHLGLLVVLDDPASLEEVVLWFEEATTLTLLSQNGDTMIGDEVRSLLPRYFAIFFDDIKDVAPDLANVRFAVPRTGDRTLH